MTGYGTQPPDVADEALARAGAPSAAFRRVTALLTERQRTWTEETAGAMTGLKCSRSHVIRLALEQLRERHSSAKGLESALRAQVWRELEIARPSAAGRRSTRQVPQHTPYRRVTVLLTEQQIAWAEHLIDAMKGLRCSISHVLRLALEELRSRYSSAKGLEAALRRHVWRELEAHPERARWTRPERRPQPRGRIRTRTRDTAARASDLVRVLIVDDHALLRAGLRTALAEATDLVVVGELSDADAALSFVEREHPDLVLMDLSMRDGIAATGAIAEKHSGVKVVAFVTIADRQRVLAAVEAGAVGFLLKDADSEELVQGIRAAARGESAVAFRAALALLADGARRTPLTTLTIREREVLGLVCRGLANKQIARRLGISEKTVKTHLGKAFQRIGVSDRTQAALWAERNGLLSESYD